jgi:hypothetical protein
MVTRRCSQRTFRLRPSALTNQIFKYCIGLAQAKTGVAVHAACVMSNHHHNPTAGRRFTRDTRYLATPVAARVT